MTDTSSLRLDRRFCVAPMVDWTDRHQRMLMRCITRRAWLYTEMTTPKALERDPERWLRHRAEEHPLALQLGGAHAPSLVRAARMAEGLGFDEIDLNMGCPSPRVGAGAFGAVLMKDPPHAAALVQALKDAVSVPVTVKLRTGVDEQDDLGRLLDLCGRLVEAGADALILHARKAWLQGLSPKENRQRPPLRYDRVAAVKAAFPEVPVVLNGGIETTAQAASLLASFDGVMVGRAAYEHPYRWLAVDPLLFGGKAPAETRRAVLHAYLPYMAEELSRGTPLSHMARHLLPLFNGLPGARAWRRRLATHMHDRHAGLEVVEHALSAVEEMDTEASPPP